MEERWRPIPGFDGYEASDFGRVRSWWNHRWGKTRAEPKILHPVLGRGGHLRLCLKRSDGVNVRRQVGRFVLESFDGPVVPGSETRHLDGNPGNNQLSNLSWGSHRENMADKIIHGTNKGGCSRGSRHGRSKLTEGDVRQIRSRFRNGETKRGIARLYCVDKKTIQLILAGKTWAHVFD